MNSSQQEILDRGRHILHSKVRRPEEEVEEGALSYLVKGSLKQ